MATVLNTPEPVFKLSVLLAPLMAPFKLSARLAVLLPPEVLMLLLAASVMAVPTSPIVVGPLLVKLPARVTLLGVVAVKPALKVKASEAALPNSRVPALAKVVALVMVLLEPVRDKL
jgi:hypothetical protein